MRVPSHAGAPPSAGTGAAPPSVPCRPPVVVRPPVPARPPVAELLRPPVASSEPPSSSPQPTAVTALASAAIATLNFQVCIKTPGGPLAEAPIAPGKARPHVSRRGVPRQAPARTPALSARTARPEGGGVAGPLSRTRDRGKAAA